MQNATFFFIFYFVLVISILAQSGSSDPSFGINGFSVWDNNSNTDAFYNMARGKDGSIFLSGYTADATGKRPTVIQLDVGGIQNNSFGNNGIIVVEPNTMDGEAEDIAVYNEHIYVAYYAEIDDVFGGAVKKYDLLGKEVLSFGDAGSKTITYKNENYIPRSLTTDSQENIFILATRGRKFVVLKTDQDGIEDSSYGDGGYFSFEFEQGFANVNDINLQGDTSVLITGQNFISSATDPKSNLVIFKLNSAGNADATFNQTGFKRIDLGQNISLNGWRVFWSEMEEKIVAIGSHYTDNHDGLVVRLNADGSNDAAFGENGIVLIEEVRQPLYDGFVDLEGRYIVAGDDYIIRLTSSGEKDLTFGTGGIISENYNIFAAEMDAEGNYLVAGTNWNGSNQDGFIAKYFAENSSTSTDDDFNQGLTLELFPNPFVEDIQIVIDNQSNLPFATLFIQNLKGQVIYQSSILNLKNGPNQVMIEERLSAFEPQTYILSIITEKGITSKKITKIE